MQNTILPCTKRLKHNLPKRVSDLSSGYCWHLRDCRFPKRDPWCIQETFDKKHGYMWSIYLASVKRTRIQQPKCTSLRPVVISNNISYPFSGYHFQLNYSDHFYLDRHHQSYDRHLVLTSVPTWPKNYWVFSTIKCVECLGRFCSSKYILNI